ncbi:hypothetical protein KQI41_05080 [Tissierella pigra]|uniref:Uncharacterized protein n=1 Tax=Tissierella pigra TaxID=2607614 RepID=A0A6N7Y0B2_9FIRM|nr:hypothetical protein [Tissierella pigra]MBU5425782.1 hypothetical protein [Tissierella pigra]MSU01480.1 hypothetical protein [Tissierella pigra]
MKKVLSVSLIIMMLLTGTQVFAIKDIGVKEFYGDSMDKLRQQVGETEIREAIRKPQMERGPGSGWMYTSTDRYILSQQGIDLATLRTRVKWEADDRGNILAYTYDLFEFSNVKSGVNTIRTYRHYEPMTGIARLTLTGEAAAGGESFGLRDAVDHVYHVYADGKYAFSRYTE